jgi:hypothetical protein
MRYLSIILFVCFLSVFTFAQTDAKVVQKLDDYFTNLAAEREFNGCINCIKIYIYAG